MKIREASGDFTMTGIMIPSSEAFCVTMFLWYVFIISSLF